MKQFFSIAFLSTLLFSSHLLAGEIFTSVWSPNTAIRGADTVAYFSLKLGAKAVKGKGEFKHSYKKVNWLFATQENLEKFKANPEKYAPQYGGYCAYAVGAKNDTASIEVDQWDIVDGKLYLNYNASVKADWEPKKAVYIKAGDVNWPALKKGL